MAIANKLRPFRSIPGIPRSRAKPIPSMASLRNLRRSGGYQSVNRSAQRWEWRGHLLRGVSAPIPGDEDPEERARLAFAFVKRRDEPFAVKPQFAMRPHAR